MSQPASGSNKRLRTDSNATQGEEEPTTIKRDDDFWFEDGTVILIARNVEFRVYKGILAKHSLVFADMFSLSPPVSAPPHSPETSRDAPADASTCPVVHLSDAPEDLRHVIRLCMSDSNLSLSPFSHRPNASFHMIYAVIRIAHKYQMESMLSQAVQFVKMRLGPSSFNERGEGTLYYGGGGFDPVGVVNMARLIEDRSLLPPALLICSMEPAEKLLGGYVHEDGSVERLLPRDLIRCIDAHRLMTQKLVVLVMRIFSPIVSEECSTPETCGEKLKAMLADVEGGVRYFAEADVTRTWLLFCENTHMKGCCSRCWMMLKERDFEERRKVWNELPEIMGIQVDSWDRNPVTPFWSTP